jgi:predicted DNA-binding transcriptional regulator AlpA
MTSDNLSPSRDGRAVEVVATPSPDSRPCEDLVDLTAIAEMLGTTYGTVRSWRYRDEDFPQPLRVPFGPVWHRADIEAWWAGRKRK